MNDTKNRKYIGLYLPHSTYNRVMELLDRIPHDRRPSRSFWITEAIMEKLDKEEQKND